MNDPAETVSLNDKWELQQGRVVISGTQALIRVLMAQSELDRQQGLNTAGYITGYRGAPFGNVDTTLWSLGDRVKESGIVFQPGLNEDIAVTAIRGTQEFDLVPNPRYDGVYAAWYAKGPGVDRSGDALKHGNFAGAHRNGGALIFYGDDHAGKSSTVAHQSEQAMAASLIPSLYPSSAGEILEFGLLGYALSRYSGSWVGMKCVNEVAEQTATVDIDLKSFAPVLPEKPADLPNVHIEHAPYNPLRDEQIVVEHRLPLVHAFVRANNIDRVVIKAAAPTLGIVAGGKSFSDVRTALSLLGLDDEGAARAGISLYKVGCIWPLEPEGILAFANGQKSLLVVEEKRSFVEQQAASLLINQPSPPKVIGKFDENGASIFSPTMPLDPSDVAVAIANALERLGAIDEQVRSARDTLNGGAGTQALSQLRRVPYFCSGCPHNRSTRLPDGSLSMTGIGCHAMIVFGRPETALPSTQMGGEGANWIGLSPFTDTPHMFQNLGEGTYYHSGLLAIRAAVAAKVNITYKILYNDAVAMTGGQPVDGPISVAQIARQVRDEGVERIVLLSDNPDHHRGNREIPSEVSIGHRDTLDEVQRELREVPGCTILIYEQTCAAEKRRRRKRGTYPDPPKRLFISKAVCEGCGDCSAQSTCVSLTPVETAFGRKRAIDQSSCNKDYSCINGFCPSFVTIHGAEPRKPKGLSLDENLFAGLATPKPAEIGDSTFNIMVTGVGGTGVITVAAIIGMAAHIDGMSMSHFDMTGLSQKNGAVYSHVRIARSNDATGAQRLSRGEADLLLAFDLVAAMAPESLSTLAADRSRAIVNVDVSPTLAFQFDRDFTADPGLLLARLRSAIGKDNVATATASTLALWILGDTIGTNLFLMGIAAQRGQLPVSVEAIERAVALNGVSVPFNIRAFRLGRLFAEDAEKVQELANSAMPQSGPLPATLDEIVQHRSAHLVDYQGPALADRYKSLVEQVRVREDEVIDGSDLLAKAVARNYAKLLAYKDEYEVARILTGSALHDEIAATFQDGGRIAFNMAPPLLGQVTVSGRPKKREFGAWIIPFLRVMARFRGLRGTKLDIFGYSAERRMERAMIAEYEALVEDTLVALTSANHEAAVALLDAVDTVRGYGPVKDEAVAAYRTKLPALRDRFHEAETHSDADRPLTAAV